jgi:hypothetical protein
MFENHIEIVMDDGHKSRMETNKWTPFQNVLHVCLSDVLYTRARRYDKEDSMTRQWTYINSTYSFHHQRLHEFLSHVTEKYGHKSSENRNQALVW